MFSMSSSINFSITHYIARSVQLTVTVCFVQSILPLRAWYGTFLSTISCLEFSFMCNLECFGRKLKLRHFIKKKNQNMNIWKKKNEQNLGSLLWYFVGLTHCQWGSQPDYHLQKPILLSYDNMKEDWWPPADKRHRRCGTNKLQDCQIIVWCPKNRLILKKRLCF